MICDVNFHPRLVPFIYFVLPVEEEYNVYEEKTDKSNL